MMFNDDKNPLPKCWTNLIKWNPYILSTDFIREDILKGIKWRKSAMQVCGVVYIFQANPFISCGYSDSSANFRGKSILKLWQSWFEPKFLFADHFLHQSWMEFPGHDMSYGYSFANDKPLKEFPIVTLSLCYYLLCVCVCAWNMHTQRQNTRVKWATFSLFLSFLLSFIHLSNTHSLHFN